MRARSARPPFLRSSTRFELESFKSRVTMRLASTMCFCIRTGKVGCTSRAAASSSQGLYRGSADGLPHSTIFCLQSSFLNMTVIGSCSATHVCTTSIRPPIRSLVALFRCKTLAYDEWRPHHDRSCLRCGVSVHQLLHLKAWLPCLFM